jgi:hypothetical protein
MNIKKQRAIEDRFKIRAEAPSTRTYQLPYPPITVDEVINRVSKPKRWWGGTFDRGYFDRNYKNGGETYDKAMALLNSPLMQAMREDSDDSSI